VGELAERGADKKWASQRLFLIARAGSWGLGLIALWATAAGWAFSPGLAPLVLAPIVWLLAMGIVFAVVDFAEDGVFDFGRGAPAKSP
jgi:sterol desaturase/sphingolipid hydroxylase (fatty acid hydroxylase superfamily)